MPVANIVPFDLSPRNSEQIWMYLDRALTVLLRRIQVQELHWQSDRDHGKTVYERQRIVAVAAMELKGHLAVAELLAKTLGYPCVESQIGTIAHLVSTENVRRHEVRERISELHHQYQQEALRRTRVASSA